MKKRASGNKFLKSILPLCVICFCVVAGVVAWNHFHPKTAALVRVPHIVWPDSDRNEGKPFTTGFDGIDISIAKQIGDDSMLDPDLIAFNRAKALYFDDRGRWNEMVRRDMAKDVSWDNTARKYLALYDELSTPEEAGEEEAVQE